MTKDQFQRKYQEYREQSKEKAQREAIVVNTVAKGFEVVVVGFGNLGYALMLKEAADALKEMGIV